MVDSFEKNIERKNLMRRERIRRTYKYREDIRNENVSYVKEYLKKWINYIQWCEEYEKKALKGIKYTNYIVGNGIISFEIDCNDDEMALNREFFEEEDVEVFSTQYSVDEEKFIYNQNLRIRGIKIGNFKGIRRKRENRYIVDFYYEETLEGKVPICGFLSKSMIGIISLYRRQKDIIEKLLKDDKSMINKNIIKWILNARYAEKDRSQIEKIEYLTKNKLNDSQKEAINGIISSKELYLIQGPPGTGKTTVIAEGVYQLVKRGKRVLIASQTNLAVDNVLEKLEVDSAIRMIRFGNIEKVSKSAMKFTKENIVKEYYRSILDGVKSLVLGNSTEENLEKRKKKLEDIEEYLEEIKELDEEKICKEISGNIKVVKEKIKFIEEKKEEEYEIFKILSEWMDILNEKLNDSKEKERFIEEYLKSCNVVGISCTAKCDDLETYMLNDFDVAIIDEVSKATLPEALMSMVNAKRVVLVGDQNQLGSIWGYSENVYLKNQNKEFDSRDLKEKYSNMKRLASESLFERYFNEIDESLKITLNIQYRMREEIQQVINIFYDNKLVCGKQKSRGYLLNEKPVMWIDSHKYRDGRIAFEEFERKSRKNLNEVKIIEKILEDLNRYTKEKLEIAIISFYVGQINAIKSKIKKNRYDNLEIEVNTVDSFQGKEKDIVLVSMVSNPKNKRVTEHMKDFRRINVAFSRAKEILRIIGSAEVYEKIEINYNGNKSNIYRDIIDELKIKNCYITSSER